MVIPVMVLGCHGPYLLYASQCAPAPAPPPGCPERRPRDVVQHGRPSRWISSANANAMVRRWWSLCWLLQYSPVHRSWLLCTIAQRNLPRAEVDGTVVVPGCLWLHTDRSCKQYTYRTDFCLFVCSRVNIIIQCNGTLLMIPCWLLQYSPVHRSLLLP